jgi:DNA-binding response OmpR family regulator
MDTLHLPHRATAQPLPHPSRRVLVAAADSGLRRAAAQAVASAGFEVLQARTGAEALLAEPAALAAVVLDIELPDIDGFRVCRQLRAAAGPGALPVLYTCAAGVPLQARFAALESGAQACLMQPLDPVALVALLRALVPPPSEAPAHRPADGPALQQIAAQADTIEAAAWRVLRHRVDDSTLVALNTVLHSVKTQRRLLEALVGGPPGRGG